MITKNSTIFFYILLCFFGLNTHAQLGFCGGNSGDPIFLENFGAGTSNTPLPAGTTTYNFANGFPGDGFYTVTNGSFGNGFDWHQVEDHTSGDVNGKCLIVNASFSAGEFYRTTVSGLCETTTYEFSAWLLNLVIAGSFCSTQPSGTIPINVRFEIWDSTDTNLLASGDTGNIIETNTPNWEEYGLVFQTLTGQNTVILKMINNGIGGCGNDLAIDDIEFKSCGDSITIEDITNNGSITLCSGETPYDTTLIVTPDNSVFNSHFYQWQESSDANNWFDIAGETSQTLSVSGVTTTTYYRAKVAEFAANLNNEDCITFSDIFEIIINQAPNPPNIECWETATLNNNTCAWEITGTQPEEPSLECWEASSFNTTTCSWEITGTQPEEPTNLECWQTATFSESICAWEITGAESIEFIEENVSFCEGQDIILSGNINVQNPVYLWNTGQITEEISVSDPGIYTVEITSFNCFTTIKTIAVFENENPIIESVVSDGYNIVIATQNEGDFEYSLNGVQYQLNATFISVEGGLYTIYVRERNGCDIVTTSHLHFVIPKFFTPNGDGFNDTFNLRGIEFFESTEVYIFDRYGKLIKSSKNQSFDWNGTFNNEELPTSDYWYLIKINKQIYRGSITLKR